MTKEDAANQAFENLRETYMGIALSIPNTVPIFSAGWAGCTNSLDYPMCNFALLNLDMNPNLKEVDEFCGRKPNFFVYTFSQDPQDWPPHLDDFEQGLFHTSMLATMVRRPEKAAQFSNLELKFVTEPKARLEVGQQIAVEFFSRQNGASRAAIAAATAGSPFDLAEIWSNENRIGAIMLNVQPSMIGIYNFFVSARFRNEGNGSRVLKAVESIASVRNSNICLQCGPHLVPWYESRGFEIVGNVDIWMLDFENRLAIIS